MSEQTPQFAPAQNPAENASAGPVSTRDAGVAERRVGVPDRRSALQDRRNEDRVMEDLLPRRNPDVPDRRINAS